MKNIKLLLLLPLVIFGFLFIKQQADAGENGILFLSPCDTPLEFSIGKIDPGFKVTKDELLEDAIAASNIWSNTQGKQLFKYVPESDFTINMVYDTRQELTSKINDLDNDLKTKQSEIDPKIADFKKRQDAFTNRVNDLNERISYWNTQGGAPKEEYDKLVAEQKLLQEDARSLNQEAKELGQKAEEYNINAKTLNETIKNYEQVLDFKPEEGLYEQEGNKRTISIFIDVSEDEFLHTLAHEFGHALGLDHLEDSEAIMYPQTTADLSPSKEEIGMLGNICKKRTVFEVGYNRAQFLVGVLAERFRQNIN